MEKTCTKCGVTKPIGDFRRRKQKSGYGFTSWCRVCLNAAVLACVKKRYRSDPEYKAYHNERALANAKRWREAHPERVAEIQRKYHQTEHGKLQHRLTSSRRRARMNGNLTRDEWLEILTNYRNTCAYCRTEGEMTIDHVIPISKGGPHTAENVVPACLSCNSKKSDAPLDIALSRLGVNPLRFKAHRWFHRF